MNTRAEILACEIEASRIQAQQYRAEMWTALILMAVFAALAGLAHGWLGNEALALTSLALVAVLGSRARNAHRDAEVERTMQRHLERMHAAENACGEVAPGNLDDLIWKLARRAAVEEMERRVKKGGAA